MKKIAVFIFSFCGLISILFGQENQKQMKIFVFELQQEISPASWRITQQALKEASQVNADIVVIHLNTYGGLLESADSIRTKILNYHKPIWAFIDNNAASAGALISIACDSIYMRSGANIGAASVVNQSGQVLPDKYQSYMRGIMRATAESHGKISSKNGQEIITKWKRDPIIAEAMVDPRTYIPLINDSGKVLTLTTEEALKYGYCEGKAENINQILKSSGITSYQIVNYKLSFFEKMMLFLLNPVLHGILIMIIVAGIYFEFQAPGMVFPIAASALAAVIYFAPLYLDGLAENWEIIIFVVGVLLIALEVFVVPGFGITGISGIALVTIGLALALVRNSGFHFTPYLLDQFFRSIMLVIGSFTLSVIISIYITKTAMNNKAFKFMILETAQPKSEGYLAVNEIDMHIIGEKGIALTILRPAGKISINNIEYDASAINGFIDKGDEIIVIKHEGGQLYVKKITKLQSFDI